MADSISPRAQAIIDEIERRAEARAKARGEAPPPPLWPSRPPATAGEAPGESRPEAAPSPPRRQASGELLALIDDVVAQTKQARTRLTALSDAIEGIAYRINVPADRLDAAAPVADPSQPSGEVVPLTAGGDAGRGPGASPVPAAQQSPALRELLSRRASGFSSRPAEAEWLREAEKLAQPQPAPGDSSAPAAAETPRPPAAEPTTEAESVRLVAAAMAVAGFNRDEVGERLRTQYRIAEPEPTLDAVFGEGSPGTARLNG